MIRFAPSKLIYGIQKHMSVSLYNKQHKSVTASTRKACVFSTKNNGRMDLPTFHYDKCMYTL